MFFFLFHFRPCPGSVRYFFLIPWSSFDAFLFSPKVLIYNIHLFSCFVVTDAFASSCFFPQSSSFSVEVVDRRCMDVGNIKAVFCRVCPSGRFPWSVYQTISKCVSNILVGFDRVSSPVPKTPVRSGGGICR